MQVPLAAAVVGGGVGGTDVHSFLSTSATGVLWVEGFDGERGERRGGEGGPITTAD